MSTFISIRIIFNILKLTLIVYLLLACKMVIQINLSKNVTYIIN